MKHKPILTCPALLAALAAIASPAFGAINITGTMSHTENFDSLPTGAARAEFNWTDNVTIPGFYLHRSNSPAAPQTNLAGALTTAAARPFIADGSELANVAPNHHGFLSLGAYSSTERALGFCPTTTDGATNWSGGTLSIVALYTNTGVSPVKLTSLSYDLEAWKANSAATNSETITVTYKVGTDAALRAELATASASATFTQPGYTQVAPSLDHTAADGFTALAAAAPPMLTLSATPSIRVMPGETIVIRWGNANEGGTDAKIGIDNITAGFTEQNAAIAATASNVSRNDNGSPNDPTDDLVNFDLLVSGSGAVSPTGWVITAPGDFSNTGDYGAPKTFVGIPISAFAAAGHAVTATVVDSGDATISNTFTVTAPWCVLNPPTAGNFTYNAAGTVTPTDDVITYEATVTGTWAGANASLTVNGGAAQNVNYGVATPLTGTSGVIQTLVFTDAADTACTSTLIVNHGAVIGTNSLGPVQQPIISLPFMGDRRWTFNSDTRIATQVSGTQADHVILSDVIDLSAVGGVLVAAELEAIAGTSSGFEAGDHFRIDLIIDGGAPVSILGAADKDNDGLLEGAAADTVDAVAVPPDPNDPGVELPDANDTSVTRTYNFSGIVPPSASTLQIRITGNSNSGNETFNFKGLDLSIAPAQLTATAGASTLNNQGTLDPADDLTMNVPVTIVPVNLAGPGWSSNLAAPYGPVSGLYTDANPVMFNLPLPVAPATTTSFTLTDTVDSAMIAVINATAPPARTFTAVLAATPNITRNENGPGPEDDSVSFDLTVTGANGGPRFALASEPGSATATSYALSSTGNTVTVTVTPIPALASTIYVRALDASYPASAANVAVAVPGPLAPADTYIIGQTNFGGLVDILSEPAPPAAWQNFPAIRTLAMHNPANPAPVVTSFTVRSAAIDLTAVGAARFTARLRTIDTSSGFEAGDLFSARLIVDGNVAAPILSTDAYDTTDPKNGLETTELSTAGGTLGAPKTTAFSLSALIPDTANSVVIEIVGLNNSPNEQMIVDQMLIEPFVGPVDSDGDGMTDDYEIANGLDAALNDAGLDRDGDGQSNISEFLAGTAANDPASTLKITDIAAAAGGSYDVTIATVTGKKYQIEESTDLGAGDVWANLGAATTATGPSTTVNVTVAGGGAQHFLRAKVVP